MFSINAFFDSIPHTYSTEARPIWAQYHGIKGHDVEQFREPTTVTILAPPQYKTGDMVYPYTAAQK